LVQGRPTTDSVSPNRTSLPRVGEQLQISRERVRQIEHEARQKPRRLDGERLYAYHQEL
jgi:DNA-directed RNA polymerase sigma subunit (sigma70/sigma32)